MVNKITCLRKIVDTVQSTPFDKHGPMNGNIEKARINQLWLFYTFREPERWIDASWFDK